jgi:hypothetical protein
MLEVDKKLLIDYNDGVISAEACINSFSIDLKSDFVFTKTVINDNILYQQSSELNLLIPLIWLAENDVYFTDLLNELLINPYHKSHQQIAKVLQGIASPTTVPFVQKAFETNFDYLNYTCSDSDVIAKWFSWILFKIGTSDAIKMIKEFTHSPNEGIAKEMLYRLKKIEQPS